MTGSRTQCRGGDACVPRTFEEAADCLGHHSERPLDVMARQVNRGYRYLANALSLHLDTHPLRGDLIVPLTKASAEDPRDRNYALLDQMEAELGRVAFLVPRPAAGSGAAELMANAQQAIQKFGGLLQRVNSPDADANGVIDANDALLVEHDGNELIAAVAALVESAKAQIARAPGLRLAAGQGGRR